MSLRWVWLAIIVSLCGPALGADFEPLLTISRHGLLSEDFTGGEIPQRFRTLYTPDAFRVVDGALRVTAAPGQERATHGAFLVGGHDLTLAFSVKFFQAGTLFIGVDGYKEEFQGNTHLVRFSLTPERMAWDQKRGGPISKHAISEANRAARQAKLPIAQPTAEQLADPNFFRTEELAAREIQCPVGQWHDVLLEVSGNELVAQVDGQTLLATATVADAKKNRIGLGLTGRSTVLVDNFRVWENRRRTDWEQVKAALAARPDAKRSTP